MVARMVTVTAALVLGMVPFMGLVAANESSCLPQAFLVEMVKGASPMDESALRSHVGTALGKPTFRTLKSIPDMIFNGLTCMDGRSDEAVLSAPGGDVGEFILALQAIEEASGKKLTQFNVDTLMVNLLAADARTDFRMCTDTDALSKLCEATGFCVLEGSDNIEAPPANLAGELLQYLIKPENVGCEHLRSLLLKPNLYGIRKELTGMGISSFYRVMWNQLGVPLSAESHDAVAGKLDLTIMSGPHQEDGLISVHSPSASDVKCTLSTLMVPPVVNGHSVRVFYPLGLTEARMHTLPLLSTQASKMGLLSTSRQSLLERVKTLGASVMEKSLNDMALERVGRQSLAGYPHYTVKVPASCCPESFVATASKTVGVEWSDAAKPPRPQHLKKSCSPDSVSVTLSSVSREDRLRLDGYSIGQVRDHFLLDSGIPFEFADPVADGVGAVDGRNVESILSVPGAALGQFAMALAVIQDATPGVQLDVKEMLTNYVLSMKSPTFTLYTDIDSMDAICSKVDKSMGARNVCPDPSLPLEQKLEQLVLAFQRPAKNVQELMLPLLTSPDASGVGDPYLKFLMADVPVSNGRDQQSWRLSDSEKRMVKMVQQGLKSVQGFSLEETEVLKREFKDLDKGQAASTKRQVRIKVALRQCELDNPDVLNAVVDQMGSKDVVKACKDSLKRLVNYIDDVDGDTSLTKGKQDRDKLHKRIGQLVPQVIQAFFELLWGRPDKAYEPFAGGLAAKMDLVVLQGQHHEHAFVSVDVPKSCPSSMSPMLHSLDRIKETSIWVWHKQAAKAYRKELFLFATRFVSGMDEENKSKLTRAGDELATNIMTRFINSNFFDVPVYNLQFSEECCV